MFLVLERGLSGHFLLEVDDRMEFVIGPMGRMDGHFV